MLSVLIASEKPRSARGCIDNSGIILRKQRAITPSPIGGLVRQIESTSAAGKSVIERVDRSQDHICIAFRDNRVTILSVSTRLLSGVCRRQVVPRRQNRRSGKSNDTCYVPLEIPGRTRAGAVQSRGQF